eukprot:1160315-Pelagomonas_calceolata.AAC.3
MPLVYAAAAAAAAAAGAAGVMAAGKVWTETYKRGAEKTRIYGELGPGHAVLSPKEGTGNEGNMGTLQGAQSSSAFKRAYC